MIIWNVPTPIAGGVFISGEDELNRFSIQIIKQNGVLKVTHSYHTPNEQNIRIIYDTATTQSFIDSLQLVVDYP